jgi:hypothetical protein
LALAHSARAMALAMALGRIELWKRLPPLKLQR